jgi:hypothetical protein
MDETAERRVLIAPCIKVLSLPYAEPSALQQMS